MGVGSSGVAALNLGRKFIGFEIDEKYFKAAEKRLRLAASNPSILSHLPNTWKTSDKTIYIANLDVYTSLLDWSKFRIHYVNNLGERSVRSVEVVPDNWNIII